MLKSIKYLSFLFLTITLFQTNSYAQNLLTNGDFESGGSGTGFQIKNVFGYSPATIPGTSVPGNYGFTTNPQLMNPAFISGGDHTSGTGRMMIVDGNTNPQLDNFFWSTGNTGGAIGGFIVGNDYTFSYWIKSVSNDVTNPATQSNIKLYIVNGLIPEPIPFTFLAPLPAQGWQQIFHTFTAASTSVLIQMANTNYSALGNDFAIDDVSITPVCTPQNLVITNPPAVCSPSTVNIKAATVTAGSSIPGGTLTYWRDAIASIALTNPTAVASSGTYYIRSLVGICQDIKPVVVTINSPPVLVVTNPATVTFPATVDITLPSVTIGSDSGTVLTYWTDSAATTVLPNPTAVAVGNTYYIKSTLGSCSDIKPVVVTINPAGPAGPPIVKTPIYLCQNSAATPLTATPSGGGTLKWYTALTGGVALPGAPTPIITTVGQTTYYVTETILGVESTPRTPIVVNVVADTGGTLTLFCDASNSTLTSVAFDFNNVTGYIGYNYSYSVAGGPLVTGFHVSPSHFDVPVPGPGTSVTFTILSVEGLPCVPSKSVTCNSKCLTFVTPDFPAIPAFCSGTSAPILDNSIPSPNGIVGTWSPATISNTVSGDYIFTPDPILNPCAQKQTLKVIVTPVTNAGTLSGNQNVCVGSTTNFSSTTVGGTWSSSDTTVATVNAATGVVTGISAGTATIEYTVLGTGGCSKDSEPRTVTVTAPPIAGTLSGNQNICVGLTSQFSSTVVGGAWSSSNTAVATVDPITGLVTGIAAGTSTIKYTVTGTGSCAVVEPKRDITIIAIPNAGTLSGNQNVCVGLTVPFTTTSAGGTWSSSDTTVATVNAATGVVRGVSAGTATIKYTVLGNGVCSEDSEPRDVTVTAPPIAGTLSGNQNICVGLTTQFSSTVATGTWSSSNTAVATVDPITGLVTGIAAGTSTIKHTVSGARGCIDAPAATREVNVIALITPDFNDLSICSGAPIPTLSAISANGITGTWLPPTINNATNGSYVFTPDPPTQCASPKTINVTVFPSNTLVSVDWTVTNAFSENQVISIFASDAGSYLYQLDDGPLQSNSVFEQVSSGMHTVKVVDQNGCSASITVDNILAINYPKFFTPNGDNINDVWNIFDLKDQLLNSRILIFDRYGKFLKEIFTKDIGWDGIYNGQPLPASDYWFTVDYVEQDVSKQFKSHFSLKR